MPSVTPTEQTSEISSTDRGNIESNIATFDERELCDLSAADAALDIAILLYRARDRRGLSQTAAAKIAGLQQQAVSRFEQADANPRLETIHEYLTALGYALEVRAIDIKTGEPVATAVLA